MQKKALTEAAQWCYYEMQTFYDAVEFYRRYVTMKKFVSLLLVLMLAIVPFTAVNAATFTPVSMKPRRRASAAT